jgi:hypothetical protein
MEKLPIDMPAHFQDALGYPGGFRWVSFYWEPCGDEAMYDDGFSSGDCCGWGFLDFVRHPRVAPLLAGKDLGSSEDAHVHRLLCDLEGREIHVGERLEVVKFLAEEVQRRVGHVPKPILEFDDIEEILERVRNLGDASPGPSIEQVEQHMREEEAAVAAMVAELDQAERREMV